MTQPKLNCVFLGLSISSTWGNGHATTYRALLKELARRGHQIVFLERDVPWYAENRDVPQPSYCRLALYSSLDELKDRYTALVRSADVVVVGSYVPEGIAVGQWVTSIARNMTAFYDIDTPITLASLKAGNCEYLAADQVADYSVYFSFTGGPALGFIEKNLGSPCSRALYCSVDPALYYPEPQECKWALGYLGTYAADRQPALENLLIDVARCNPSERYAVAGPQYPDTINWPANVIRMEHLAALEHRSFYNSQAFTLNVTRQDMVRAGYSPSVRLFEAAACGVPILTDLWPGLDSFFDLRSEILPVRSGQEVRSYLKMTPEQRHSIAEKARRRVLRFHTAAIRAKEFESEVIASLERVSAARKRQTQVLKQTATAALI